MPAIAHIGIGFAAKKAAPVIVVQARLINHLRAIQQHMTDL